MSEIENQSPKELEEKLLKEQLDKPKTQQDYLDSCTQLIDMYFPLLCDYIDTLSRKQAIRLIKLWMKYPLTDMVFKPKNKNEKDVFLVGDRILAAKYSLILITLTEAQKVLEEHVNNVGEKPIIEGEKKDG